MDTNTNANTQNNTSMYLTRHLQRIDDSGALNTKMDKQWNQSDSRELNYRINPYLSDKAEQDTNINNVVRNFEDIELDSMKNIDVIISSPYLRCLQTSIILTRKINELKKDSGLELITQIHVNFGLGEFADDIIFFGVEPPLDIKKVFDFSLCHLAKNGVGRDAFIVDSTNPEVMNWETEPEYYDRIKSTLNQIYQTYSGKNILVITHAQSGNIFINKNLAYTQVIKINTDLITNSITNLVGGNLKETLYYKEKYLKYKNKYIQLKKKSQIR